MHFPDIRYVCDWSHALFRCTVCAVPLAFLLKGKVLTRVLVVCLAIKDTTVSYRGSYQDSC